MNFIKRSLFGTLFSILLYDLHGMKYLNYFFLQNS